MLLLLTALTMPLSGCGMTQGNSPPEIPSFPHPKPEVADEVQTACAGKDCSAWYEWLGRLHKLEDKLKVLQ